MSNELKEEIIILLQEARNKIAKANIIYDKFEIDDVYLKTIKDLLSDELISLTNKKEK